MLIFVRAENGDNIVIDVGASDPIEIIEHDVRDRNGVPLGQQRRSTQATRQWMEGIGVQHRGGSTVFVTLRLLSGIQSFVERFVTDGEGTGHSSTEGDSECSDDSQHTV